MESRDTTAMNIPLTMQQVGAWIARIGSVALIALGAIPSDGVPSSWHNAIVIAGAIILAVDRYVTSPATGLGPEKTQSSTLTTSAPATTPPVQNPV